MKMFPEEEKTSHCFSPPGCFEDSFQKYRVIQQDTFRQAGTRAGWQDTSWTRHGHVMDTSWTCQ